MFEIASCCAVQRVGQSKVSIIPRNALDGRSKMDVLLDVRKVSAAHSNHPFVLEPLLGLEPSNLTCDADQTTAGIARILPLGGSVAAEGGDHCGASAVNRLPGFSLVEGERRTWCCKEPQVTVALHWDDVLFPMSYLRDEVGDLWQGPPSQQGEKVAVQLSKCDLLAAELLRTATQACRGRVAVVASVPRWVDRSCRLFFPATGALIDELDVVVVGADELGEVLETADGVAGMESCVLSIGPGSGGETSTKHCRTRTHPSAAELATQLELLAAWIVPITKLTGHFVLDLS